jgi:hypothetical protein
MVEWFQSLFAEGLGIFLVILAMFGGFVVGVRVGKEKVWLRWVIGIAVFWLSMTIFGPALSSLRSVT